jgi:ribosome-binding protein aMBF1 (putative translation factor)
MKEVIEMKADKRNKLEASGWRIGDTREFLGLTEEEVGLIETRIALASALKTRRRQKGITQVQLARRMRSSQSRVAKMEALDPSVTIDLLVRALLSLGLTREDLAKELGRAIPGTA